MRKSGSALDPLWYKNAVIYELHVKAFADGNNDGIGDFAGLLEKLDYLEELGVTCIWLLPFFPSPLRDDGYDISDYMSVHPSYGTLADFRSVLDAAHARGMQVMVELVVNHTSDQHPWFQAARQAPPGSPERDFYVWSDSDQKYKDARIIFTDTEKSNWTWDPVAKAYYWHRFFSHQPDLNYDNPIVVQEVLTVMRYWLDLGVDGLRLDAIPYLVERDGTNCENLPETHVVLKTIRATMDAEYENRMILAEANQWPSDVRPYFGDGDECHMAFHFPLMPRIFMALRLEDRLPVVEIMDQTPDIPATCQWGLFLRNHDELTLEMVNEEERDYMYLAYSADPRMRVNIGIRRRLAPLMDNNQRRIELLNSLLFSFPGTPILYYGDEIGMGDNIYLGDRNGVRTPMQWSADRNAGFSRCTPAKLFSPVIMDPVYGYEAVNVEAQASEPSSMLNWMRNMIALRKLFGVFGSGSIEFLHPENRKVLAYLRKGETELILCVANLSRFAQPVELDLGAFRGMRPVEMLGYVEFPIIGDQPYPLTLGPYGFLWFELQRTPEQLEASIATLDATAVAINMGPGWDTVFGGQSVTVLERELPGFLYSQRWFGGKSRRIASATVVDWGAIPETSSVLAIVEVRYQDDESDLYAVPLTVSYGSEAGEVRSNTPTAILCPVVSSSGNGSMHDAMLDESTCTALLECVAGRKHIRTRHGHIRGVAGNHFGQLRGTEAAPLTPRRSAAEQSNTSIIYGDQFILKLFRRLEAGPNPDCEMGRFFTEKTTFRRIPPFGGSIEYEGANGESTTIGMLQGLVTNEGDGWKWYQEELARYYERHAPVPFPTDIVLSNDAGLHELPARVRELARDCLGICLESASTLGRRTAEMHLALGSCADDPAFAPEPLTKEYVTDLTGYLRAHAVRVLDSLKENLSKLPDEFVELGGSLLSRRRDLMNAYQSLPELNLDGSRTRIHGDYHLGQVLLAKGDYVILDFEGEPARSLAERRAKYSPLKDVAGMLRSFTYAAQVALLNYTSRRSDGGTDRLAAWAGLWEHSVIAEYLQSYKDAVSGRAIVPTDPNNFHALLRAYMLDKALYELHYEMNHRPAWVGIPAGSILGLLH